jgi:tetratricopeptide (TPR) repeat protein
VSLRLRVSLIVAAAAAAAATAVVGVTLATRQTPEQPQAQSGKPPLGQSIPSPAEARIRAAFRSWPKGSLETMEELGREYPRDPVVQLYRGIALLWAGYTGDAEDALRKAKSVGRDTPWEVRADDLLHQEYFPGYPVYQPLRPNALLERGARLQQEGHQHSAQRVFDRAARQAPDNDEAQVAAAVARFDKDNLNASFSRLGPLTRRFPESQTVRFYLGLLLAWTAQRDASIAQFEKTVTLGRETQLGQAAADFLVRVQAGGTDPTQK